MTNPARTTKPLAEATLTDAEPRHWMNGRYAISTTIAPHGRSRGAPYPVAASLMFRAGDDRAFTGFDLEWGDIEQLHADLGELLANRKRYKEAIRKASANKSLKFEGD